MKSNISFKGAFYIRKPSADTVSTMRKALGKGTLIYEKFNKAQDVIFVTRSGKDLIAADYIRNNDLKFKYYQGLNTSSGFIPFQPQKALELIKASGEKYIRSAEKMISTIKKNDKTYKPSVLEQYPHVEYTIKRFRLNTPGYEVRTKNGVHTVLDKDKRVTAKISNPNGCKKYYVQLIDKNSDISTKKLEISSDGGIYEYGSRYIKLFVDRFKAAAKYKSKIKQKH